MTAISKRAMVIGMQLALGLVLVFLLCAGESVAELGKKAAVGD
jgi:hypothetical protein